ncbi:MAG: GTPase, partial [Blastocatellia bacterium]
MTFFYLISKILISTTISKLAQKGKSEIIKFVEERARLEGIDLQENERKFLKTAFEEPNKSLADLIWKLDFLSEKPQNKGIVIIGPSGSGKSTLFNFLNEKSPKPKITTKRQNANISFSNQAFYIPVSDTPG